MRHRFTGALASGLAVLAFALMGAGPASADDSYGEGHRARGHHGRNSRDRHGDDGYSVRNRNRNSGQHAVDRGGLGHAVGDVLRYGSTDQYSSRRHYSDDRRRMYDHERRDRHRGADRYQRQYRRNYYEDDYDGYSQAGYGYDCPY